MTMDYNLAEARKSETSSIPSELGEDPNDDPETSLANWPFEGNIVKTELIIPSDQESIVPRVCRLCCVKHTTWFPFYKSDGNLGLETKHLEMIRILASIHITHTRDHSSAICSFCLMKIEEFAIIRDIWRRNDKSAAYFPEPVEQACTGECKAAECEQPNVQEKPNEESTSNVQQTPNEERISNAQETPNEESIVINDESDDSDVQIVSSSTSLVPESVSKRVTRSDKLKSSLIQQAMRIVGEQFNKTKTRKVRLRRTR